LKPIEFIPSPQENLNILPSRKYFSLMRKQNFEFFKTYKESRRRPRSEKVGTPL
jgi:hypothetical protein